MLANDQNANSDPNAPPSMESRRLSVNNCRTRRHRLAPMDSRSAISLWRAETRASRRLATFEHAISSTSQKAVRITKATGIRFSRSSGMPKKLAVEITYDEVGHRYGITMRLAEAVTFVGLEFLV